MNKKEIALNLEGVRAGIIYHYFKDVKIKDFSSFLLGRR